MKKLYYLIVLVLILGLVLTGCLLSNVGQVPTTEQSGITYLTKAELLPGNLVGLWHFDEGEGDTAYDSSGTIPPNDGTVYGAGWVDGKFGKALIFDGDDYISVDDSTSLDTIVDLTVELWLNPTITYDVGAADYYVFVSKFGPNSFQFVYAPGGFLYLYVTGGMAVRSIPVTLYAGTWYHLAATFDSGTAESNIYVDKVDVTSSTTTQNMTTNDCPLFIGVRPCPTPTYPRHFVKGIIDEVRIWNVALSSDQLGKVYDFKGFFPPVDNDYLNVAKAGRAIPVKFSLNGDQGLDIFAANYPLSIQIECDEADPDGEIEDTVTAIENSLNYDAFDDQYIFVWKTNKAWAGTCRRLEVKLKDGTSHFADFYFK